MTIICCPVNFDFFYFLTTSGFWTTIGKFAHCMGNRIFKFFPSTRGFISVSDVNCWVITDGISRMVCELFSTWTKMHVEILNSFIYDVGYRLKIVTIVHLVLITAYCLGTYKVLFIYILLFIYTLMRF